MTVSVEIEGPFKIEHSPETYSIVLTPLPRKKGVAGLLKSNKPVGHWKFDESQGDIAKDSSGKNDANVAGEPVWAPDKGKFKGAIQLNGKDSAVEAKDFSYQFDTITITAWINGYKAYDWAGIVFSRRSNVACGIHFGGDDKLHYTWNNNSSDTWSWSDGPEIPRDKWAFVAGVIEPDKATLYVYTEEQGLKKSVNPISHIAQKLDDLKFGWDINENQRRFEGLMDDIRIYDFALTEEQIKKVATGKRLTNYGNFVPVLIIIIIAVGIILAARKKKPAGKLKSK